MYFYSFKFVNSVLRRVPSAWMLRSVVRENTHLCLHTFQWYSCNQLRFPGLILPNTYVKLFQTRWVDIIIYLAPGQAPTEDCSHLFARFLLYSMIFPMFISFVIHACARDKTWPLYVFWSSHHHDRDSKVNIRRKIKPFQNGGITFPLFGKANQKPWSNHFIHSYMISVGLYLKEKNNR